VTIKRIQRNKNKFVTSIYGLEAFGKSLVKGCFAISVVYATDMELDIDLKKAAKLFAQKFATGASVSKNPQGQDEIVVQVMI
jgi:density-regulated protein